MVKTLGIDIQRWYEATEKIYARNSTVDFWRADGQLAAVEKLRFGVTTSLTLFGGGDNVHRTDDTRYGDAYLSAVEQVGLRWFLAVGPRRAPFPKTFTHCDFRPDNMLFGGPDGRVALVDWQTSNFLGTGMDVAYFLGGCFDRETRRKHERDLLKGYHDDLLALLSPDRVGATVPVRIVRSGQVEEVNVAVGER